MTTRRLAEAIPHFEAALRINANDAEAQNDVGFCQMGVGKDAAAIPHLEAAVRLKPDYVEAHFNLGWALSKIPARIADAISQYEAGLRLKPDDGQANADVGKLLAGVGRRQEAIAHLEAAQRVHPDRTVSNLLDDLRSGQR
jgi:tetratricopeptide (TPR) repeat protein